MSGRLSDRQNEPYHELTSWCFAPGLSGVDKGNGVTLSKLWESVANEFKIKLWRVYGKRFLSVISKFGSKRMQCGSEQR